MLQDLLECRRNGWKERRAKDGPHKIGPTKSNTMQQNMQHRRDQERSMARERQRQTLSQQQQQQQKQHRSVSQDARQQRYSSSVRILSRDNEPNKMPTNISQATAKAPHAAEPIPWDSGRVANRVRSALDEYAELGDSTELLMSLDEIPQVSRGYTRAFELALTRIVEGNNAQRENALGAIRIMIDKKSLKFDVFADALLETLECLPDLAIDSPKAVDHVADLLLLLLELKIIDPKWLTHDLGHKIGDPSKELVPERGFLFRELVARLAPDSHLALHFRELASG